MGAGTRASHGSEVGPCSVISPDHTLTPSKGGGLEQSTAAGVSSRRGPTQRRRLLAVLSRSLAPSLPLLFPPCLSPSLTRSLCAGGRAGCESCANACEPADPDRKRSLHTGLPSPPRSLFGKHGTVLVSQSAHQECAHGCLTSAHASEEGANTPRTDFGVASRDILVSDDEEGLNTGPNPGFEVLTSFPEACAEMRHPCAQS